MIGLAHRDGGGPFFHDALAVVRARLPQPGDYLALVRQPDGGEARIVGVFHVPSQEHAYSAGPFSIAAAFGGVLPDKCRLEIVRNDERARRYVFPANSQRYALPANSR